MKIVVSYISSLYEKKETIKKIDESTADGIHVDLMDGIYVENNNLDISNLYSLFKNINKPIDIHLMCDKPSKYFNELFKLNPICIYIHPDTEDNPYQILKEIKRHNIKTGIVINPNEEIDKYNDYYLFIDRVLLMSVYPGKGGQEFLKETAKRLDELLKYKNKNEFEIYIDGGINDETIKLVSKADGVVSGSFVCNNVDFNKQIEKLKINKKLTIWAILKLIPLIIFLEIAVYYTIRGVNCSSSLVGYKKCDFLSGMLLILKLCFPFAIASLILFISGIIDLVKNYKK